MQDCTELRTISQLKDLMNDYDYLKNVLNKFSTHVEMFHSQFHKEIVILSACTLCSYDTFLGNRELFEKMRYEYFSLVICSSTLYVIDFLIK